MVIAGLELMQSKKETDVVNTDDGSGEPVKSVFEWEYQEDIGIFEEEILFSSISANNVMCTNFSDIYIYFFHFVET